MHHDCKRQLTGGRRKRTHGRRRSHGAHTKRRRAQWLRVSRRAVRGGSGDGSRRTRRRARGGMEYLGKAGEVLSGVPGALGDAAGYLIGKGNDLLGKDEVKNGLSAAGNAFKQVATGAYGLATRAYDGIKKHMDDTQKAVTRTFAQRRDKITSITVVVDASGSTIPDTDVCILYIKKGDTKETNSKISKITSNRAEYTYTYNFSVSDDDEAKWETDLYNDIVTAFALPSIHKFYIILDSPEKDLDKDEKEAITKKVLYPLQYDERLQHIDTKQNNPAYEFYVVVNDEEKNTLQQILAQDPPSPAALLRQPVPDPRPIVYRANVQYFTLSDDWNRGHVGDQFFKMGLVGTRDDDDASEKGQQQESATEMSAIRVASEVNGTPYNALDCVYFVGKKEYAQNVGTWAEQAAIVTAGGTLTNSLMRAMVGKGGTRRHHRRCSRTTRRNNTRAHRTSKRLHRRRVHRTHKRGAGVMSGLWTIGKGVLDSATSLLGMGAKTAASAGLAALTGGTTGILPSIASAAMSHVLPTGVKWMGSIGTTGIGVLSNAILGTAGKASTAVASDAAKLVSGGLGSIVKRTVGGVAGLGAAYVVTNKIYESTNISEADHREVWGNQVQDYVRYKGVHVGEPLSFYYETLEFTRFHKKYIVYYFQYALEHDLHPRNVYVHDNRSHSEPSGDEDATPDTYLLTRTHDYVPLVACYDKSVTTIVPDNLQALWDTAGNLWETASSMVNPASKVAKPADESPSSENKNNGGAPDSKAGDWIANQYTKLKNSFKGGVSGTLDRNLSSIYPPELKPSDLKSTNDGTDPATYEAIVRQHEKLNNLNRLTGNNEALTQENVLHSLSTLNERRLDILAMRSPDNLTIPIIDKEVSVNTILGALLGAVTGKEFANVPVLGKLTNLALGDKNSNIAAALAAGFGVYKGDAIIGRIMRTMLRSFVPPACCLLDYNTFSDETNEFNNKFEIQRVSGMIAKVLPAAAQSFVTRAPVPLREIRKYPNLRLFFDQFSHNWARLDDETECHFCYTDDLRNIGIDNVNDALSAVQETSNNKKTVHDKSGVVLAFEAGAEYRKIKGRKIKVSEMLDNAFQTPANDAVEPVPWLDRARVMLFGQSYLTNMEYDIDLAENLLRHWHRNASSSGERLIPFEVNGKDAFLIGKVNLDELMKNVKSSSKTLQRHQENQKKLQEKSKGGAPDDNDFSEFYDVAEHQVREDARKEEESKRHLTEYGSLTQEAHRMEEHARRWVLTMLLRSMQKKFKDKDFTKWTISQFLDKQYDDIAYHTIVLAVVPFGKDGDKPCKMMYPTGERANVSEYIGPFVLTCKKSLSELTSNFNAFTRQAYARIVRAIRKKEDVAKDEVLTELGIVRVRTFGVFNTEPYDYVNGKLPESKRDKLQKAVMAFKEEARSNAERTRTEERAKQQELREARRRKVRAQMEKHLQIDLDRLLNGKAPVYNTRLSADTPYHWYPRPALTRYDTRRNRYGARSRRRYDGIDDEGGRYDDDDARYDDDPSYDDDASYEDELPPRTRATGNDTPRPPRADTRTLRTERRRNRRDIRGRQRRERYEQRIRRDRRDRRRRTRSRVATTNVDTDANTANNPRRILRYDASAHSSDASDPNMDNFSDGIDSSNASTDSADVTSEDDRTVTSSGDDASSSGDVVGRSTTPRKRKRKSKTQSTPPRTRAAAKRTRTNKRGRKRRARRK